MVLCADYLIFKVNEMSKSTAIKGEFSSVTGSTTRRMFDASGNFIGLIIKVKEGYQIRRFPDGEGESQGHSS